MEAQMKRGFLEACVLAAVSGIYLGQLSDGVVVQLLGDIVFRVVFLIKA